jgi:hypothetical protein
MGENGESPKSQLNTGIRIYVSVQGLGKAKELAGLKWAVKRSRQSWR